ncbi:MAG: bifunctional protein-disulfide isomerase/oxidoreductase DsbC [Cardiobacteriaceae bacterium]|nr:bifunctional protein-disulfide isomerase/oxidoreductase DsbC [Cardiobacteriaceae bacterium]
MFKKTTLSLALFSLVSWADDAAIQKNLQPFGFQNIEILESPVKGLRTVVSDQGILYASEDGQYFLQGQLVQVLEDGNSVDLTNKPLMGRLKQMENEMVVHAAKDEKHVITVFFDITCHYCQLLHKDTQKLNDLGITVRYLAFPRQGIDSANAEQMEAIFAAENPKEELDAIMLGKKKPSQKQKPNIVSKHYNLGLQFGVEGTPAIITEDGQLIGGYLKPDQMIKALERL